MEILLRKAILTDIPFLVEVIIEAEKAGTEIFSYSTIFGTSQKDAQKYIALMLDEEVDGCELSVSSFLVAEYEGKIVGSLSAWVEGSEGIPSSILKGNLLNYVLPKECIERAKNFNKVTREVHIEYIPNTIQIGVVYVVKEFRGKNLSNILIEEKITQLTAEHSGITDVCVQIFSCNIPSLKAFQKSDFEIALTKESAEDEIKLLLPSNTKHLLKRKLQK